MSDHPILAAIPRASRRKRTAMLASVAGSALALLGSPAAAQQSAAPPATSAEQEPQTPSDRQPQSAEQARFAITAFQIAGNRWLSNEVLDTAVYPFMGPDRTPEDVEGARAALQAAYEAAGFATVSVYVPEQGVESGTIRLQVEPQPIGQVAVTGARDPDAIRAAAPSLQPGSVPNINAIQRDIVALNQTRRVTPELKAGVAPGTLDVELRVEETSPFHGSVEVNNYNSVSTSDTRVAASLRHDDLLGNGESLTIATQFAPERTGDGSVVSANLLQRLGRLQFLASYIRSDSDIASLGGTQVIGRGDIVGARLIAPLPSGSDTFFHSLTVSIEGKRFDETVRLVGADASRTPIRYMPVGLSWRGDWLGETVRGDATIGLTLGVPGVGTPNGISTDTDEIQGGGEVAGACKTDITFQCKRPGAHQQFFYLRGEGGVTATDGPWEIEARLSGQYTAEPLISNEQFSVGGMGTVRGYFESEALGDFGLTYSLEARSPWLVHGAAGNEARRQDVRVVGFFDFGWAGLNDPAPNLPGPHDWVLASTGAGLRLRFLERWNGALDLGVPLRSGPDTSKGDVVAKFRIWGEF